MTCPDRFTLFVGLEEGDPALRAHLETCAHCQAVAEAENDLGDALSRVRDPAPPADLLTGVLQRVEETETLAKVARRQLAAVVVLLVAVVSGGLALTGPSWLIEAALDGASALASGRTALGAIGRSLSPQLSSLALPVIAAQALALLGGALLLNRLVAVRARS